MAKDFQRLQREHRRTKFRLLCNSWYGDRELGSLASGDGEPRGISELMEEICEELKDRDAGEFIIISAKWPQIMNFSPMADYVKPADLRDGVLYIEVKHSALVRELEPSADLFKNQINAMLGKELCTQIKFIPSSGPAAGR